MRLNRQDNSSATDFVGSRPRRQGACCWAVGVFFLLGAAWLCGCSAEHYRRSADREVYSIIGEKSEAVPGMEREFRLEAVPAAAPAAQPASQGAPGVSLAEAIGMAMSGNADFLARREGVYLRALDLTYQRYLWGPRLTGFLSAMWRHTETPDERAASGSSRFGLSQALATGADMSLTLATNFLRYLSGDPRESAASVLDLTLRQHLWRGAGARIALESLTQAERGMIYELRSFVQYRREFWVSVASSYYGMLQQADTVENERLNMENLINARERAEMLAQAGRLPEFQVAEAQQDELSARDRWARATERYGSALEDFKIRLGLPVDRPSVLDPAELSRLKAEGVQEVPRSQEEMVQLALRHRLDLANSSDGLADAERNVAVAKDNLGLSVDLILNASIGTLKPKSFWKFREKESSYGYGLDVDLPVDRLQQRNAYRGALIALDRTKRDYDLMCIRVRQQVNEAWRRLREARQSYEIQQKSVELAARRVDSTSLLMDAGRATMRNVLDAQRSLLDARNALTGALVDYRIAMLQLWRDSGVLTFQAGQFKEEIPHAESATGR